MLAPTIIFIICAVILLGVVYALWRYWDDMAQVTPEEEAFDRRVARLNERQANRISDEELRRSMKDDDAWQIMVARGEQSNRRSDRYAGDVARRTRDRKRSGQ